MDNDKDNNSAENNKSEFKRTSSRLSGQEPDNNGLPPKPPLKRPRTAENFYGRTVGESVTGKHAAVVKDENGDLQMMSPIPSKFSRPAARLGTPATGGKGYNKSLYTPYGTRLQKTKEVGDLAFYSERLSYDRKRKDSDKNYEVEEISQEVVLNRDTIKKVEEEIARRNNKRGKSQNSVMGGSAKEHAHEHNVSKSPKEAWEWLHLIGFQFIGPKGQDEKNLVGGTYNANTDMLVVVEQHIKDLVKEKGEVTLGVKATIQKGTKIADQIDYKISADNMKDINYSFDARTKKPTPAVVGKYTKKHIEKSSTDFGPTL